MSNNNQSAVIVGASLCGLMTAIALAQTGMKVTVLERSGPNPRTGAVLQVNSGEADFSDTAKLLRKLASGGLRSPEAWNSIWSRLQAQIDTDPNIKLYFNRRAESIAQDDTSAWVLTDKGERFTGDLVIGADGYRSTVRKVVSPDKPNATFAGYVIWVALLNEQDLPEAYRPSPNAGVSMPNGIGDFLLGSVIDGETGSREPGQRRLGWAWYDNTRNKLFQELGCIDGSLVQHSLNGTDIPAKTLKELTNQAAQRWPQPAIGKKDVYQELSVQHKEILAKIIRLEERFVEEDIERELYRRYRLKYDNEKEEIEKNLLLLSKQVSNLEKVTNIALKFCIELPKKWFFADYHTKQQLQQLLFPSGIFYDKKSDKCRTFKINSVFLYVAYIQQVITKKKSGIPELCLEYSAFSALVAGSRIELPTSGL